MKSENKINDPALYDWCPLSVSLGFSMGNDWIARTIAKHDQVEYEGRTYYSRLSHVFWLFKFEKGPDMIWESLIGRGVRLAPAFHLRRSKKIENYLFKPMEFDQMTCVDLWLSCQKLHGKKYDLRHILGLLIWIRRYGADMTRRPSWLAWSKNDRYICSEFTWQTAHAIGEGESLLGDWATPSTTTPHRQYCAVFGHPSTFPINSELRRGEG